MKLYDDADDVVRSGSNCYVCGLNPSVYNDSNESY